MVVVLEKVENESVVKYMGLEILLFESSDLEIVRLIIRFIVLFIYFSEEEVK